MSRNDLITSKEIIDKTGISRATLNNYIKMGILPKPIVRKPGPEQKGVKQIGYFPADVLENILKVKLLKRQGKSMDDIVNLFKEIKSDELESSEKDLADNGQPVQQDLVPQKISRRIADKQLGVTISDINSPAYLINHDFEIEWINSHAEDLIFNQKVRSLVNVESRNVFKLLLNKDSQSHLTNWEESVILHFTILQKRITDNKINRLYEGITEKETGILSDLFWLKKEQAKENLYHLPVTIVKADNSRSSFWVHTMSFREGTFLVFVPTDNINADLLNLLGQRKKIIDDLLKNRMPSLVSLCALVADLQDSVKISAELLPSHYFELINELWQTMGPIFEKYNGIYGKHAGDGMLYYFIHKPGSSYLMNAINCAMEIREAMKELSGKWRLKKGWDNELFLNTGINEGQEFFGSIYSASNIEFTALGDTINIAGRLSDFAKNGELWTTKNLISKLSQEERNEIRFGIHKEKQTGEMFIEDSFSRVSDLMKNDNSHYRQFSSIAGLPITKILEMIQ
jgi:class 3 adenylate cyclase/predicted DNA-binding transcriptional regulator AlpA